MWTQFILHSWLLECPPTGFEQCRDFVSGVHVIVLGWDLLGYPRKHAGAMQAHLGSCYGLHVSPNGSGVVVCSWIAEHVFYLCLSDALLACCLLFVLFFFASLPFLSFFSSVFLSSFCVLWPFFRLFVFPVFFCFNYVNYSVPEWYIRTFCLNFSAFSQLIVSIAYWYYTIQYLILQCSL